MWSVSASHLHCHAQFSNPPLSGQWSCWTQPSQPQCPPTLAGSSDRGGCRMGRPAAGWDSYWAFERWARSSHLPNSSIMPHKRTQIKRTHSCLRSHIHIQALSSLFSSSPSLCEPKPGGEKKKGPEFRLSLSLGGHGSARRKRQVVFWLTSLSINIF